MDDGETDGLGDDQQADCREGEGSAQEGARDAQPAIHPVARGACSDGWVVPNQRTAENRQQQGEYRAQGEHREYVEYGEELERAVRRPMAELSRGGGRRATGELAGPSDEANLWQPRNQPSKARDDTRVALSVILHSPCSHLIHPIQPSHNLT